jgi:hypothetical protein
MFVFIDQNNDSSTALHKTISAYSIGKRVRLLDVRTEPGGLQGKVSGLFRNDWVRLVN